MIIITLNNKGVKVASTFAFTPEQAAARTSQLILDATKLYPGDTIVISEGDFRLKKEGQ